MEKSILYPTAHSNPKSKLLSTASQNKSLRKITIVPAITINAIELAHIELRPLWTRTKNKTPLVVIVPLRKSFAKYPFIYDTGNCSGEKTKKEIPNGHPPSNKILRMPISKSPIRYA